MPDGSDDTSRKRPGAVTCSRAAAGVTGGDHPGSSSTCRSAGNRADRREPTAMTTPRSCSRRPTPPAARWPARTSSRRPGRRPPRLSVSVDVTADTTERRLDRRRTPTSRSAATCRARPRSRSGRRPKAAQGRLPDLAGAGGQRRALGRGDPRGLIGRGAADARRSTGSSAAAAGCRPMIVRISASDTPAAGRRGRNASAR